MQANRRSFWRRNRWLLWVAGIAATFLIAVSIVLAVMARRVEPYLRAQIVAALQQHFHTRVELDQFHVSADHGKDGRWGIWATGQGLRIWPPHRTGGDHPLETSVESIPLIQLARFDFHVPLRYESGKPVRIAQVQLQGLDIHIPPKSERDKSTGVNSAMDQAGISSSQTLSNMPRVEVERVICSNTHLVIETDKPDKLPLEFEISRLLLTHPSTTGSMDFDAELTNPRPEGIIDTTGSFGPWNTDDAGESPVSGSYRFQHADLSVFKDIAGILTSTGKYQGTLRNIAVDGEAGVPDFRLTDFGNARPLQTQFRARVDGTNGDTHLDSIDAVLGRSHFTVSGKVVGVRQPQASPQLVPASKPSAGKSAALEPISHQTSGQGGHLIDVKVNVTDGRLDDFMRLVNHSPTPLLDGAVQARASVVIPPGEQPVQYRMKLDGTFNLTQAHFSNQDIQKRVAELSLRGQGKIGDLKTIDPSTIASDMQSTFHIAKGIIALPDLRYSVPGAEIQLNGTFALEGAVNFDGTARLQATVSKVVGGWKGFLLKPADRFFKKDGAGTQVPIKVRGTREHPEFGLNFGNSGGTHPETPGEKPQAPPQKQ